ncbi:MAG: hypothetical protein WKF84_01365 [Pyrinomonadaceae bacterium]
MLDSTGKGDDELSLPSLLHLTSKNCGYLTKKSSFAILVNPLIFPAVPQIFKEEAGAQHETQPRHQPIREASGFLVKVLD